jgi:WD40 repeat protein
MSPTHVRTLLIIVGLGRVVALPALAAEPDQKIVFTTNESKIKALQETPDGKTTLKIERVRKQYSVAWLFDKTTGKTFGSSMQQLDLFIEGDVPVTCWAFSPDGKYVVTGAGTGNREDIHTERTSFGDVRVWDATTGELVAKVGKKLGYVERVAFRADSKTVEYVAHPYNIDGP